jgi:hypothetical protein
MTELDALRQFPWFQNIERHTSSADPDDTIRTLLYWAKAYGIEPRN